MKCISCGREIPEDSKVCPECGEVPDKPVSSYDKPKPAEEPSAGSKLTYAALGASREKLLHTDLPFIGNLQTLLCLAPFPLFLLECLLNKSYFGSDSSTFLMMAAVPCIVAAIGAAVTAKRVKDGKALAEREFYSESWRPVGKFLPIISSAVSGFLGFALLIDQPVGSEPGFLSVLLFLLMAAIVIVQIFLCVYARHNEKVIAAAAYREKENLKKGIAGGTENAPTNADWAKGVLGFIAFAGTLTVCGAGIALTGHALLWMLPVLAVCGVMVYKWLKQKDQWKASGLILDRPEQFYRNRERFILKKVTFEQVLKEIGQCDFTVSKTRWSVVGDDCIQFYGYGSLFSAELSEEKSADAEHSAYHCKFSNFAEGRDPKTYEVYMNLVLTQIEKAILRLDAEAQTVADSAGDH